MVTYISAFLILIKIQFGASIKNIRSDNGLEFFNSQCNTLFPSQGIIQQNGIVERKHRHLFEMARALQFQAHISLKFWGEYVLTAAFLINRLPSSVLLDKSPFEVFHKQIPNLSH